MQSRTGFGIVPDMTPAEWFGWAEAHRRKTANPVLITALDAVMELAKLAQMPRHSGDVRKYWAAEKRKYRAKKISKEKL